uniref:Potassium channel tetramerisation-type BTB domain-containing protein n=1 Tax=Monodelphis domestica TaxID=13616 RepID=A0A5F8G709_MONDO
MELRTSGSKPKPGGFKGGGLGNKYIQLNVGGSLYYTTVHVLTHHDTMLKAMFSGCMEVLTDKEEGLISARVQHPHHHIPKGGGVTYKPLLSLW